MKKIHNSKENLYVHEAWYLKLGTWGLGLGTWGLKLETWNLGLICCFLLFVYTSCRKDLLLTDPSAKLEFSEDTVIFDTVFTTIGSSTRQLKIYNPNFRTLKISSIAIAGGSTSIFRINVDGEPGYIHRDIELSGGDSLFIFVEVTVNPNSGLLPMIVTDSLIFEINGNLQDVDLVAWGQDAYFIYSRKGNYFFPIDTTLNVQITLPNDKPIVVYGYAVVDSTQTLIIPNGTKLYFHKYSGLAIANQGTLKVNGTKDNPVIFRGDRLEWEWRDIPNQWGHPERGGIWLTAGSLDNVINYAVIKNANIGLQVDTFFSSTIPTLKLTNTIIENHSGIGLLAQGSIIDASNCVIANCGQYAAALVYGGDYHFVHCTFANYWKYGKRDKPMLLLNNYYEDGNGVLQIRNLVRADFENCIVYGANNNELAIDQSSYGTFKYKFENCVLKTDINTDDPSTFINNIKNPLLQTINGQTHDPVFTDVSEGDFHLFSSSAAIDRGNPLFTGTLTTDLDGKTRSSKPDAGAYEYVP